MKRLVKQQRDWGRFFKYWYWYASMPVVYLIHWWMGLTLKPKLRILREARAALEQPRPLGGVTPRLSTAELEKLIRKYAPPGVPYEVAFTRTADLRNRFGRTDKHGYSPMLDRYQLTPNDLPGQSVIVLVLFSDVVADYYNEAIAEYLCEHVNTHHGEGVAVQNLSLLRLKEVAVSAGLGTTGKNALFFSNKFGFHCKISVIMLHAELDQYHVVHHSPQPLPPGETPSAPSPDQPWRLPACDTCNLCVNACPVSAIDAYTMKNPVACERVISRDFFGHRRNKTCRACITSCPESNELLKGLYDRGVPKIKFWDYDRQINALGDLIYRPSFMSWLIQRFYFGGGIPGAERKKGRIVRGQQAGIDGVPNSTTEKNNGWISHLRGEGSGTPPPPGGAD